MAPQYISKQQLSKELWNIIQSDPHQIPDKTGYKGDGAPGRLLEELLGVEENNISMADAGVWELKFHGGSSLLTLFHSDPEPRPFSKTIIPVLENFGWPSGVNMSFRVTINSTNGRGFRIKHQQNKLLVKYYPELVTEQFKEYKDRIHSSGFCFPELYWSEDHLVTEAAAKLRNLLLVRGRKYSSQGLRYVDYQNAIFFSGFRVTNFMKAANDGKIVIDFDVRTNGEKSPRNHGTKFRIKLGDLHNIYLDAEPIERALNDKL